MTLFQTYEQVGIKEDISDVISNISPTKTPFLSGIGNEKVTNTLFQWQTDILRPTQENPVLEGADASYITVQPTVMLNNHTQIFAEAIQVSGTVDAVSVYGRARESAYQLAKSAAALKRDLEFAFVGTAQAAVAGNDSTARQMAGFQVQVNQSNPDDAPLGEAAAGASFNATATTVTLAAAVPSFVVAGTSVYDATLGKLIGTVSSTSASTVTLTTATGVASSGSADVLYFGQAPNLVYTGGSATAPTEANFLTCLQNVYTAGVDPTIIQVTPANSIIFAAFASAAGRYRTLQTGDGDNDKKLVNVVNLYVSPFGEQKVIVNRFLKASDSLVYDPKYWSRATLRPWTRETLAKTGDSLKMMIVGEFSLKCKNPSASGLVIEQTSSGY